MLFSIYKSQATFILVCWASWW